MIILFFFFYNYKIIKKKKKKKKKNIYIYIYIYYECIINVYIKYTKVFTIYNINENITIIKVDLIKCMNHYFFERS